MTPPLLPITAVTHRLLSCQAWLFPCHYPDHTVLHSFTYKSVTDMTACLELISKLERTPISKEVLESTRLGRHINNIRRKTNHQELYRRLKDLVRKWRKEVLADGVNGAAGSGPGPGPGGTAKGSGNGHPQPNSPSSLPSSGNTSPGVSAPTTPSTLVQRTRTASPTLTTAHSSRPLKPVSPALLRGRVFSPGLSLASTSPAITPPLAYPTRPRSRPQSPSVNPGLRQPSRADASSYAPSAENVAKTNTANKRLRKDDEDSSDIPVAKRPRNNVTNGFDEDSRDSVSSIVSNECAKVTSGSSECSKSRRIASINAALKGKSAISDTMTVTSNSDQLQQKMAAIPMPTKAYKVKTTSQIVAELAERKGDSKLAERASKLEEQHVREVTSPGATLGMGRGTDSAAVTRNKMDHLQRYLSSQSGPAFEEYSGGGDEDRDSMSSETEVQRSTSPAASPGGPPHVPVPITTPSNLDLLGVMNGETAEEILARLPPIDHGSVVWDDPEDQTEAQEQEGRSGEPDEQDSASESEDETERLVRKSKKVPPEKVGCLHSSNLDCQNGNFDVDGKFREWHEVLVRKGYQDDPLIVLPYVITDF
ncbi:mediator of RNA polymerase II transcription subunit 26-like isoform X2 [Portunus trituberculatus]|uniref:mediator of RNA polymerase II transcription subunit 26-like isoform X2 n=1 Tax=Portunus trituberculatus TaxID=210409 RepID=UPI001E1CB278|nr:mediator of RNA polymerase II transcription subunit 26-like isoform X2 [Portunus trituberculatus]